MGRSCNSGKYEVEMENPGRRDRGYTIKKDYDYSSIAEMLMSLTLAVPPVIVAKLRSIQ